MFIFSLIRTEYTVFQTDVLILNLMRAILRFQQLFRLQSVTIHFKILLIFP